ncbi:GAF and ANTAR domain-containing protein [Micromonospora rifamycinica]|uniref:GAF and ANTAR domain-containing protein n=1 Tax=Micromonospora rifamycinica TaxID=291594 RepID=UPI002E2DBD3E|nr:GAF and ANTAR domain-containing protein [Micromonospora rifamycinica]
MPQSPLDITEAVLRLGFIRHDEMNLDAVLTRVTEVARDSIPDAAEVTVTLVHGSEAKTAAHTSELALQLDTWQYEHGRGPCLDAATTGAVLIVADMTAERRWPEWSALASAAGVRSCMSIGLPIQEAVVGALNLYATRPDAFGRVAETARTIAGHAAVALANAHLYDSTATLAAQMREAMRNRAVIEQAKGIIMGQRRCTADEAFGMLAQVSQNSNRKLRDVADALVQQVVRPVPGQPTAADR